MGNCFPIICKHPKTAQLVKMDGKMIQFMSPILVKDVIVKFSGLGVGLSKKASQHLPPSYELKLGSIYYLLPLSTPIDQSFSPAGVSTEENGGVKSIKVIITKRQLRELLSKQVLAKDVLSGHSDDSLTCWKPKLESILEENELCSV